MAYDERSDEFFAYIDDGTKASQPIFQIDDTREMVDYIKDGTMSHIDDTDGLEDFLKQKAVMQDEDSLLLCEEMIW